MNAAGGGWIETLQESIQRSGTSFFAAGQPRAQPFIARRQCGQAFEQGAEIKSRSADDHRQAMPRRNRGQDGTGAALIIAR